MTSSNINSFAVDAWIRGGQAAETAQELAWIVGIIFVIVGYLAWRGDR